jgi:hypothetical protein
MGGNTSIMDAELQKEMTDTIGELVVKIPVIYAVSSYTSLILKNQKDSKSFNKNKNVFFYWKRLLNTLRKFRSILKW